MSRGYSPAGIKEFMMEGIVSTDCDFEYSYERCSDENCYNCMVCCDSCRENGEFPVKESL